VWCAAGIARRLCCVCRLRPDMALWGPGGAAPVQAGWRGLAAGVTEGGWWAARAEEDQSQGGTLGGIGRIGPLLTSRLAPEVPEQFALTHPLAPD